MAIAVTFLLCGCQTAMKLATEARIRGNTKPPTNFYLDEDQIQEIQRVAMMPVHAPNVGLTSERDIDEQFISKLTATQLFEVIFINREDLSRMFGQRSFSSAAPLTDSLFKYLKETTDADAVVFFDITSYQPFRPIKVGVRGKIIRLPDKTLLWAVDELYDSAIRKTSKDAVAYEKKYLSRFETSKKYDSILISPIRFTAFAAEKSVLSLPPNSLSRNY